MTRRRVFGALVLQLTVLLTGCSTSGNRLTLFPQNHRLIDSAKEIRQAAYEPQPLPRELNKQVLPTYIVEPGDVLLIQPADLDSPVRLPADQPIQPDGTINLGRYGRIVVAGKSLDEIEALVKAAVEPHAKDVGPITARLITRQSKVYYVLGDVNAPGSFQYAGRETVLDGIIAAGGLTDRSSRKNIILSRPTPPDGCRVVLPICYEEIVQLGDTSTNYQLLPGDRIYVASRGFMEDHPLNRKKVCLPCGGPQYPCINNVGCACAHGGDASAPAEVPSAVVPPAGTLLPPAGPDEGK